MPVHKLANGPITLTIAKCEEKEGNFGPQWLFSGSDGMDVYISEMAGAKGLARLNLDQSSVIGKTIRFEQVKKDGKTFTNLEMATGTFLDDEPTPTVRAGNAPTASAAPRPAAPTMDLPTISALYGQCVDMAMSTLGAKCEAAGVPFDAAAIQSAAATLFIRLTK